MLHFERRYSQVIESRNMFVLLRDHGPKGLPSAYSNICLVFYFFFQHQCWLILTQIYAILGCYFHLTNTRWPSRFILRKHSSLPSRQLQNNHLLNHTSLQESIEFFFPLHILCKDQLFNLRTIFLNVFLNSYAL